MGDGEQEHPHEPLQVRRRLQRRPDRLGRAGVQPEDRQAHPQLGRARPHPAEPVPGLAADQRVPVGRLPRQLDRVDGQRSLPRLHARHVGRLPGRHRHRQDRVDARREATRASSSARAPPSSGSTTCSCEPGSTVSLFDDHCCQLTGGGTYVPADGTVPGTRAQARPADARRPRSQPSTRSATTSTPSTWATPSRWRTATCSSAGARNRTSPSTAARAACCSKGNSRGPNLTYRATVEQWVGEPLTPPVGAALKAGGKTTVYASWNGATQVASWRVLAGSSATRPRVVASAARSGFETAIPVPQGYQSFQVQALAANRQVIGASRPFTSHG